VADKVIIASPEVVFRQEVQHVRCGGTYLAHSEKEIVSDDGECPVCRRVLAIYKATFGKQIVTTAGTPLAAELGMPVSLGKPGLIEGTPDEASKPVQIDA
jgi:hypothetical protein